MGNNSGAYKEVGRSELSNERELIISKIGNGNYTLAQVAYIPDDGRPDGKQPVFMKNSMRCTGDHLLGIYVMIGKVLAKEGFIQGNEDCEK